jgi:hypothetical protein
MFKARLLRAKWVKLGARVLPSRLEESRELCYPILGSTMLAEMLAAERG